MASVAGGACLLVVARATRATASGVMHVMEHILRFRPRHTRQSGGRPAGSLACVSIREGDRHARRESLGSIRVIRPAAEMQKEDKVNVANASLRQRGSRANVRML